MTYQFNSIVELREANGQLSKHFSGNGRHYEYAPVDEQYKATGTDGTPSTDSKTQNLINKEGKILPFSPNRVGSSTVGNGAASLRSFELPVSNMQFKLFEPYL